VTNVLSYLAVATTGLFAGAMLTEGFVLVPYWRSLPPDVFFAWYGTNDKRLTGFFGPLTWLTALTTLAAAVASWWTVHPRWIYAVTASACVLIAVGMFFAYFERANASFSAATIPPSELPAVLNRWAGWHWARSCLSLIALVMALSTVWQ